MNSIYFFNKSAKILFVVVTAIVLIHCTAKKDSSIDYPGQKSPGMKAELFAPGIISTKSNEHSALAFSPDGTVILWAVMDSNYRGRLLEMKYANGSWSKPVSPSFADTTVDDYCPSFSIDGKKLFFSSRRKAPAGYPEDRGNRIWSIEKTSDGWGAPVPFDTTVSKAQEFAHSISKNGTLYFSSAPGGGTNLNIRKAEKVNDSYTKPVLLPYSINSVGYEDGPCIAPDEDFLIFESTRPEGIDGSHDLYISFKNKNGHWGLPVNMGPKINSGGMERFARLSPDGKYLFFGSNRDQSAGKIGFDIYWIDAKVIDELRDTEVAKIIIEQPLGDDILNALDKSDVNASARLLKQWLSLYPYNADATVIYSSTLRKQKNYSEAEQLLAANASRWNRNKDIILEIALVKFGLNKDDEAVKLLASVLTEGDQLRSRYLYLANSLFDMAKFKPSDEYFEKAMSIGGHGVFWYNRACGYTNIGHKEEAFEALNKAAVLGYNERKNYEGDPDLVPLKSDARWNLLMEKLE